MRINDSSMRAIIHDENYHGPRDTEVVSFSCGDLAIERTIKKTKGGGPWVFKTDEDVTVVTDVTGITFHSHWLNIMPDGAMTVSAGYAWDGNSKKLNILDLVIVGVPDGIIDVRTMRPKTWYASLVHDALYQYYGYHGIARRDMDAVYRLLATEARFLLTPLYWLAVRAFGGLFYLGKKRVKVMAEGRELVFFRDFLGRE